MMESDGNDVNNQKGKSCTVRIERKKVLGKMKSSPLHNTKQRSSLGLEWVRYKRVNKKVG